MKPFLLTVENAKTTKGETRGYLTAILYLAPANELYLHTQDDAYKKINLCPFASKGCKAACLFTAGRGVMRLVKNARVNRTKLLIDNPNKFFKQLVMEIQYYKRKADRKGFILTVRLNGTSDIRWENYRHNKGLNIFGLFPNIQFYDYTKDFKRQFTRLPDNYHLTFSRSESNERHIPKDLNVTVVFKGELPDSYMGRKVINGDETDLRFLDKAGVVVGLKAKGKARKNDSGFAV